MLSDTLVAALLTLFAAPTTICMDVRKAFLYFDPRIFVLVRLSTRSQTSLNRILCLSISTRITLEIELFTVLNSFVDAVKT